MPGLSEGRIFLNMDAIHIVAATQDGKKLQFWAVAAEPQRALVEVLQRVPSGWMVTLTGENLNPQEAAALGVRPFEVRKLGTSMAKHPRADKSGSGFLRGGPVGRS